MLGCDVRSQGHQKILSVLQLTRGPAETTSVLHPRPFLRLISSPTINCAPPPPLPPPIAVPICLIAFPPKRKGGATESARGRSEERLSVGVASSAFLVSSPPCLQSCQSWNNGRQTSHTDHRELLSANSLLKNDDYWTPSTAMLTAKSNTCQQSNHSTSACCEDFESLKHAGPFYSTRHAVVFCGRPHVCLHVCWQVFTEQLHGR